MKRIFFCDFNDICKFISNKSGYRHVQFKVSGLQAHFIGWKESGYLN